MKAVDDLSLAAKRPLRPLWGGRYAQAYRLGRPGDPFVYRFIYSIEIVAYATKGAPAA